MENEALLKIKKAIKLTILIVLGLFVVSSFCFFIGQMWIPLGFLIGLVIAIINNVILYNFSYYLTRPYAKPVFLSLLSYGTRMLLYGLGFFVCIFLDYLGYRFFFWGTCLASYMISIAIIVFVNKQ